MTRPTWLRWAHELQTIAQAGLTYARDRFDLERYRDLGRIAAEIIASHSDLSVGAAAALLSAEPGYVTPKIDVRGVVFDHGKILMVQERSDGRWSLPGGWADVGESAAEVTAREVKEEAGIEVRATKLLAVLDKQKHGHPQQLWYCYKIFFRCEMVSAGQPSAEHEIAGVGWFERNALPPLSRDRVTEKQMQRMFEHHDRPDLPADFD